MLEGDEVIGNFPCIWEVWNGCWKVMRLWKHPLHLEVVKWMLDGDEVVGNFPCIWEVWSGR